MPRTTIIGCKVTHEEKAEFDAFVKRLGVTRSQLLRALVKGALCTAVMLDAAREMNDAD